MEPTDHRNGTQPDEPPTSDDQPPSTKPSLRERGDELRAAADQTWRRVEDSRSRNAFVDAAFETYERDRDRFGPLLAAALAFRLFLVFVPYVVVVTIVAGFFLPDETDLEAASVFGLTASTVADVASQPLWGRIVTLLVVGWALLLAARSMVKALRLVHLAAWELERTRFRDTTKAALVFLGYLSAMLAATAAARQLRETPGGLGIVATTILVFVVYLMAWVATSTLLPRAEGTSWTSTVPGSVVFAIGAQVFHVVVVLWIVPRIDSAQAHYGALGIAILLLGGVYLLGRLIVAAAFVNATLWFRSRRTAPEGAGTSSETVASSDGTSAGP